MKKHPLISYQETSQKLLKILKNIYTHISNITCVLSEWRVIISLTLFSYGYQQIVRNLGENKCLLSIRRVDIFMLVVIHTNE